ncbi:hypothetical protein CCYA_CCYA05G1505 [Cyanidiococcus yangmingshanensis]|nr:hypothetical protein CCYA_CCYA05G1505 [Cyanidiococcus yangmingshanensis]
MERKVSSERFRSFYSILGLLLVGTVASLLAKIIYGVESVGRDGRLRPFRKPLFEVFSMFFGMSLCRVLEWLRPAASAIAVAESSSESVVADPLDQVLQRLPWPWHGFFAKAHRWLSAIAPAATHIILIPATLDAAATMLMCTGLLFAPVSVYQMLRGSMLVFCAIFSVTLLGRRLHAYNVLGVLMALGGISAVGLASVAGEHDLEARGALVLGIMLMIAGQAMQALQVVAEEHLLQNLLLPPMRVVSYEGIYGIGLCMSVIFPLAYILPGADYGNRWEDTVDSLVMIVHSRALMLILLTDAASMLLFNMFSMNVTQLSSALFRTMLETLRTFLVWIIDLWIYYRWSEGRFGEAWTPYSWLQVVGFLIVVAGTWVYGMHPVAIGPQVIETADLASVPPEHVHKSDSGVHLKHESNQRIFDGDQVNYRTLDTTTEWITAPAADLDAENITEYRGPERTLLSDGRQRRASLRGSPLTPMYGTSPAFFMRHAGSTPAVYVGSPLPFAPAGSVMETRLSRNMPSRAASDDSDSEVGP